MSTLDHVGRLLAKTQRTHEAEVRQAYINCSEALAKWMIANGFATGHGDTMPQLLDDLAAQIRELRNRGPVER